MLSSSQAPAAATSTCLARRETEEGDLGAAVQAGGSWKHQRRHGWGRLEPQVPRRPLTSPASPTTRVCSQRQAHGPRHHRHVPRGLGLRCPEWPVGVSGRPAAIPAATADPSSTHPLQRMVPLLPSACLQILPANSSDQLRPVYAELCARMNCGPFPSVNRPVPLSHCFGLL